MHSLLISFDTFGIRSDLKFVFLNYLNHRLLCFYVRFFEVIKIFIYSLKIKELYSLVFLIFADKVRNSVALIVKFASDFGIVYFCVMNKRVKL